MEISISTVTFADNWPSGDKMTTVIIITAAFVANLLLGCRSRPADTAKSAKDTLINKSRTAAIINSPRDFVMNYGANDRNPLFVFVGEKISVLPLPNEHGSMDNGFKAKYVILKKLYGNFPKDTIEFIAYDHYGTPLFSRFTNVLLYVSSDSGTYYHQKYLYNDVYKTKDGRWAGTYAGDDYGHAFNKRTKIKPIKIDFAKKVAYPIKWIDDEGRQLTFSYPAPYFKTIGDSAIAIYGNFAEELFSLKRTGVLTARGLFKSTPRHGHARSKGSP